MLRVFGPARLDGVDADSRGRPSRRQRQLLAALAVRPGHVLPVEVIADWMWGEQGPGDPNAAVQTLVHRLRRSLSPLASIDTTVAGYRLVVPEDGVDVMAFEEHIRRARATDPETALTHLTAAVELWEGEPYADLDHADLVAERGRLLALSDEAHTLLMQTTLRLGRHREALVLAEEALSRHPHDETALAVLMTALYATGQQVAALSRLAVHREQLADELGLDPSQELRDLEQAILRHELVLPAPPPAGSAPGPTPHTWTAQEGTSRSGSPQAGTPHTEQSESVPDPRRTQRISFCRSPDGTRLAYATSGTGPPLVKAATWLTHLNDDWDSPVWRHWLDALSSDHALLRYDERGCGLSEWQVSDISFDAWVTDLEAVVDAEGLQRFPLLGLSQGAAVAVAYAVRHPERVSALLLYGGYARGRTARASTEEDHREARLHLELARVGWGRDDPAFRQVFTSQIIPDGTRELWASFNALQARTCSAENAVRFMEVFGDIDVTDEAARVTCPTLVMHSRHEVRQPVGIGLELASLIPGSRFVPLPSRNHLLTADEPAWELFLQHSRAFLAEHADRS